MANRAAAMRYARALFDVAQQQGALERVEQETASFLAVVEGHTELRSCLRNPAVPPGPKTALVTALLERAGGHADLTVRLLTLLAERARLSLLSEILGVYRDLLMVHQGVVRARVTTAEPMAAERVEQISRRLGVATGKDVTVETGVDPEVIGGVVTQIGSTVWDGSIASHLARMRQQFSSDG